MLDDTQSTIIVGLFLFFVFVLYVKSRSSEYSKRKKLYNKIKSTGVRGLRQMTWQDFERYCAFYFELGGFSVKMCGLGGADGGIDLIIQKKGKRYLVQCKHWKSRVGVGTVREMFGVMAAEGFHGVYIVSLNGYTKSARDWARGKPIKLLSQEDII